MAETLEPSYVTYLQDVSTDAAVASMAVVEAGQAGGLPRNTTVKPEDGSLLTDVDTVSEQAGNQVWERTGLPSLGEEMGIVGNLSGARVIGKRDPIDGTRPFVIGAHTSTTMSGAYDLAERRFVAATIGHPTSQSVIEASNGTTRLSRVELAQDSGFEVVYHPDGSVEVIFNEEWDYHLGGKHTVEVWNGPLKGSTVLVDNFAPFSRGKGSNARVITDKPRILGVLGGLLDLETAPQGYGSNGYHQMLLAKGGDGQNERMAGAVMLAQGGPWDAIGLLAVENSGGSARAYHVEDDGRLSEQHPHDPFSWDILVLGNNQANTDAIAGVVEQAYGS